jgi:hypothetical protein
MIKQTKKPIEACDKLICEKVEAKLRTGDSQLTIALLCVSTIRCLFQIYNACCEKVITIFTRLRFYFMDVLVKGNKVKLFLLWEPPMETSHMLGIPVTK